MITLDEYLFSTKEQLDSALANHIADLLEAAVTEKSTVVLVLSGGNTPKGMLNQLCRKEIPWEKVTVLLADERWVDPDNDRSNEKMIRQQFLQEAAARANFSGFYQPDMIVGDAPAYLENRLRGLEQPVDVTVLGMGEDGHTASLFPCAGNIEELIGVEDQLKTVWVRPQTAPDDRISLSFPVLKKSKNICVHFTGELKKEIFQKMISDETRAPLGRLLGANEGRKAIFWAS